MITLCSNCGRLKVSEKHYIDCAVDLSEVKEGQVSHGICPDCVRELYPELAGELLKEK